MELMPARVPEILGFKWMAISLKKIYFQGVWKCLKMKTCNNYYACSVLVVVSNRSSGKTEKEIDFTAF
jgi:hypothetical protein